MNTYEYRSHPMSRIVTLRVKEEVYKTFVEAAEAENRSVSNLIETAALAKLHDDEFADDYEMAEIRSNQSLVDRLKKGSKDARNRRGRFVE
jgi:uncharacterized protein (DUF1778 family)